MRRKDEKKIEEMLKVIESRVMSLKVRRGARSRQSIDINFMSKKTDEMIHIPGNGSSGFFLMFTNKKKYIVRIHREVFPRKIYFQMINCFSKGLVIRWMGLKEI